MNLKTKILIIGLLFFANTVHAVSILPIPETFWDKVFRCTWHLSCYTEKKLGTSITTIAGSDTLSASRTTLNNNFSALNVGKIENSTTSVASITTLSNLASVGTLTTGVWNGTAITGAFGGTSSTTLSTNQVLLGNGASGVKVVTGFGTSGQLLTSNGPGSAPTFQSASFDTSQTYNLTGPWTFNATSTMATTSINRLGIGTTTPAQNISISGNEYITGGLGVGIATTSAGNVRVSQYLQVDDTASTTNMVISNSCIGCFAYMGTSSNIVVGTGSNNASNRQTITFPVGAIYAVIAPNFGGSLLSRFGSSATGLITLPKDFPTAFNYGVLTIPGGTDNGDAIFTWTATTFTIEKDTDANNNTTIGGKIYWYR